MVHQFLQREDVEPWTAPTTIYRFWIRRFFRIAPLSYPLLVLGLGLSRVCGVARVSIGEKFPHTLGYSHSHTRAPQTHCGVMIPPTGTRSGRFVGAGRATPMASAIMSVYFRPAPVLKMTTRSLGFRKPVSIS